MTEAETNIEFDKLCEAKGVKRQDIEALFDLAASDEDDDVVLEKIAKYPEPARALFYKCVVPPQATTDRSKGGD